MTVAGGHKDQKQGMDEVPVRQAAPVDQNVSCMQQWKQVQLRVRNCRGTGGKPWWLHMHVKLMEKFLSSKSHLGTCCSLQSSQPVTLSWITSWCSIAYVVCLHTLHKCTAKLQGDPGKQSR
jgi:hypothetical protein